MNDAAIILARIEPLFQRLHGHIYQIRVAKVAIDGQIHFFFEDQPRDHRFKSIPLHSISLDLDHFEEVIRAIRSQYGLSFNFYGFVGDRWPSNGNLIQKKLRPNELFYGEQK
ncbi:MAG: acetyl-CoA carboxylase [Lactobacillus sp.]|jgi:hypothetical protein|nr:acetyl-CoA carboxylase [Lactobacillus sp.]MCI2032044.1 acetyl-CoA carboxylase [Lactobacillus sp.]